MTRFRQKKWIDWASVRTKKKRDGGYGYYSDQCPGFIQIWETDLTQLRESKVPMKMWVHQSGYSEEEWICEVIQQI